MNFKQYDDGEEGRFFIVLDNGMEGGWIQYKWLDNGNILADGTLYLKNLKTKNWAFRFSTDWWSLRKKVKQKFIRYVRLWSKPLPGIPN